MHLRNVTLEMSLKPFRSLAPGTVDAVCRKAFTQWLPLVEQADMVSVLLWTGDGSEILEYRGELDDEIEWGRYIGGANPRDKVPNDPEGRALHSRPYLYMDDPPRHTYRSLAAIVAALKRVGAEVTGKPVRVGETFDPGPEFAKSPFKYERHNEICMAITMGRASFVCCYGVLKADREAYAGFPDGIPDGTPFGRFLGRQSRHFLADLGFDYLWLSNGLGFGMETWATTGALFDGERFHPDRAAPTAEKIREFWRLMREELPGVPLETRGTNLTTGIDLASDAVPVRDIYATVSDLMPPPNSPWAALNGDFGFELVGYMSHIARVPAGGFPYRFYVHDPWWLNSPWLDRYGREPHDIYLPLAVSRIDASGDVQCPVSLSLLTIDDSYGSMPDQCPQEVIPHLLAAIRQAPDAPGPLVWVYPWDEYHEMTLGPEPRLEEVFYGDWFMRAAVNAGLPLNTVMASGDLPAARRSKPEALADSVLVSRVPDGGTELSRALLEHLHGGGKLLLHGPTDRAGGDMLSALGLAHAAPLSGELSISLQTELDTLEQDAYPDRVTHRPLFCAGGITEVLAEGQGTPTRLVSMASDGAEARAHSVFRAAHEWSGGAVGWTRGTNSASYRGGHLLTLDDPAQWLDGALYMRLLLAELGWRVGFAKRNAVQRPPITTMHRGRGGLFLAGYVPDTTVSLSLRTPWGAPVLLGCDARLAGDQATYHMPRAWVRECRAFVDGQSAGVVSCAEEHSGEIGVRRRMRVRGLRDATVTFLPESGTADRVRFLVNPAFPFLQGDFRTPKALPDGALRVSGVTGALLISW